MTTPVRLGDLVADIATCRRCPRLADWREEVARTRVARHRDSVYWGRPVPGFGDPQARLLLVGLAPAAHGANRTGRVFTGDNPGGSGELLFEALHRAGYSPRERSVAPSDGLVLNDAYIAAVNRCAPPANKPTTAERDACLPFPGPGTAAAELDQGHPRSWRLRLDGCVACARRAGPSYRSGHRASGTARKPRSAPTRSSAATTPASRTPSPGGSR